MKSKLRTLTIITYLFMLSLFGYVSINALFFKIDFIIGIITGLIFLVLIFIVYKYFSIIEIRQKQNEIILQKPLQIKKIKINFSEVNGYNFFVMSAKSNDYMGLKIITKNNFYYLSDFETENFHEIENEIIRHFTLCKKGTFEKENDEQKSIEINNRKKAKERQNKDIKDFIKMSKFLSLFMVFMSILDYYTHQTINSGKILFFTTSILLVWYTFYKSHEINKKSKYKV